MVESSLLPVTQTKVIEEEQQQLKLYCPAGEQVDWLRKVINKVVYCVNTKCGKMFVLYKEKYIQYI